MFTAQRHNGTFFGENPADGYLLPWNTRSHPIELTWHHKEPIRRQPKRAPPAPRGKPGAPAAAAAAAGAAAAKSDVINAAGFVEEGDAPNRVQYMTGSQWMNLPAIDYLAFAGPSSNFAGVEKLLPFLQVREPMVGGGCKPALCQPLSLPIARA